MLVVSLLLGLPLLVVFIDAKLLKFIALFLVNHNVPVYVLANVSSVDLPCPAVVVVSGDADFFARVRGRFKSHEFVMWILQQPFRGVPFWHWRSIISAVTRRCSRWDLLPIKFRHNAYGGATNASHVIAFSAAFGVSSDSFVHPPNVTRTLRHFRKPADNSFVRPCRSLPAVDINCNKPIVSEGLLRLEGLLPVSTPHVEVCGPSVFHPGKLVRRKLSRDEFLAVYDVPSALCSTFLELGNWSDHDDGGLPFKVAPSPVILSSLMRQLWGSGGGVEIDSIEKRPAETILVLQSCLTHDVSPTMRITECSDGLDGDSSVELAATVDLGVDLYPNDGRPAPSDDCGRSAGSSLSSKSSSLVSFRVYDTDSDDDSFMPR